MTPLNLQPIPYQGSKRILAPKISKLFPENISTLYEPFAGSAAITVFAAYHGLAKSFVIGDIYPQLIELWELIINQPHRAAAGYRRLWEAQNAVGPHHFNDVREKYNTSPEPCALLYLIARCVKNAVRFNKKGHFTQSVDKRRKGMKPDKMEKTIHRVSSLLRGRTRLFAGDFTACVSDAGSNDLVYLDPPYQGTTYGRDKRYAAQLERERLISTLVHLNHRQVPFILSYDGRTGEREYGSPLPPIIEAAHLVINAGRSSQATLSGRDEITYESLYISKTIASAHQKLPDYTRRLPVQASLFAE